MSDISTSSNHKVATWITTLFIVVVSVGFLVWKYRDTPILSKFLGTTTSIPLPNSSAQLVQETLYTCQSSKTIDASYFVSSSTPVGSVPPATNGSVSLVLSDGRSMTLMQTQSASGARYANMHLPQTVKSFIFWNKGNTAFIEEGDDQTQTYTGCIAASNLPETAGWKVFTSPSMGISVRYPPGYVVNTMFQNTSWGSDTVPIPGVKFTIPAALYQGTNLSGHDTGVSIEQMTDAPSSCLASAFLPSAEIEKVVSDAGVEYSVAGTSDAGAGNFYEETVYTLLNTNPCTAVHYFIHSTNIGNYTTGSVKEFDRKALLNQFDLIRRSLVLGL